MENISIRYTLKKNLPHILTSLVLFLVTVSPNNVSASASSGNYKLERESFGNGVESDSTSPNYTIHGEIGDSAKSVESQNYGAGSGLEFLNSSSIPTPTEEPSQNSGSGGSSGSGTSSSGSPGSSPSATSSMAAKTTLAFKEASEKIKEAIKKLPQQTEQIAKEISKIAKDNPSYIWVSIAAVLTIILVILLMVLKRRRRNKYPKISGFGVGAPGQN